MTPGFLEVVANRKSHAIALRTSAFRPITRLRMMAVWVTVVAALLLAVQPSHAQNAPNLAAFDQSVANAARDWKLPGMAVAIAKKD